MLHLGENNFWLSTADNRGLLWAMGVASNSALEVTVGEPDGAGKPFGLRMGHTSSIRRIEAELLSYRMDMDTNPFELSLGRVVDLDMEPGFIGKATLQHIKADGIR